MEPDDEDVDKNYFAWGLVICLTFLILSFVVGAWLDSLVI